MGASRTASEVEEQTDGRSIQTIFQGHALTLEHESVSRYIHTLLDEEVRVARISEFEGYTWTVSVSFHHEIEVIGLSGTGSQLGVDMELTLPL